MKTLEDTLQKLADELAKNLLTAVIQSGIGEVLAVKAVRASLAAQTAPVKRGPGRPRKEPQEAPRKAAKATSRTRTRRDSGEVDQLVELVVAWVKEHEGPTGVASTELAAGLKKSASELTLPVQKALAGGKLRKRGERQFTRYFAGRAS